LYTPPVSAGKKRKWRYLQKKHRLTTCQQPR
jgi:hypothetical protein